MWGRHIIRFPVTGLSEAITLFLAAPFSGATAYTPNARLFNAATSPSEPPSFQRAVALPESLLRIQSSVGGGWTVSTSTVFPNIQEGQGLSRNKYSTAWSVFWGNSTLGPVLDKIKKKQQKKKGRKRHWRKEVLGAPPVRQLEFLQPPSAYQGSWKWGR